MVKTRSKAIEMENKRTDNTSQQTEHTVDNTMTDRQIENVSPTSDVIGTSVADGNVTTAVTHTVSDVSSSWFTRFEAIFQNLSQQVSSISEQMTTKQEIANLQESQKQEIASLQESQKREFQSQQHFLNRLEQQQMQIVEQMVTREEIETRFKQLEEAQQNLPTLVSEEVNRQLNTQLVNIEQQISSKFSDVKAQVSTNILSAVNEKVSAVATQIDTVCQTTRTLPSAIENITQDLSALRVEHENLKSTVTHITSQAETIVTQNQERVQTFLDQTEAQLNDRLTRDINNMIHSVAAKVYKEHSTSIRSLQEELSNVKATLQKDVLAHEKKHKVHVGETSSEWLAQHTPTATCDAHIRHTSPVTSSLDRQNNVDCDIRQTHSDDEWVDNDRRTTMQRSQSPHRSLTSILLEENLLNHHQFPTFIPEKNSVHPVIFIQSFRELLPKTWSEHRKIRFVMGYIQGEGNIWAAGVYRYCATLQEFENAFLSKYWSVGIQERVKNEIYNPPPFNERNGSLRRYFEKYLNKARFFDEPMSHREVLRILIGRLPTHLRLQLVHIPIYNLENFLSTVESIDLIYEDDRARNGRNNNGYGDARRYTNSNGASQLMSLPPIQASQHSHQNMQAPNVNNNTNAQTPRQMTYNGGTVQRTRSDNRYNPGYNNRGNNSNHNRNGGRNYNTSNYNHNRNNTGRQYSNHNPSHDDSRPDFVPVAHIATESPQQNNWVPPPSTVTITEVTEPTQMTSGTQTN